VHVDDLGFTLVDLAKIDSKEDPFIMSYQAKQVFYVKDPSILLPNWDHVTEVDKNPIWQDLGVGHSIKG